MRTCLALSATWLLAAACAAEPAADARTADHAALRALLGQATTALNTRQLDSLAAVLHQPCSIVAVDQSRATSPAEVKALFDRWVSPAGGIASLTFKPEIDGPAEFLDERTAFASGTSQDTYVLNDGRTVVIPERWTATMVKDDAGWRVATLHTGVDLMANPVLDNVRSAGLRMAWIAAAVALVVGALSGVLLGRRRRAA